MPTRAIRRVSWFGVVVAAVLSLFVAFYVWTAATGPPFERLPATQYLAKDPYNLLADALAKGEFALPAEVPAAFTALPDPYDDKRNVAFRDAGLHDVIFYEGKLYASWGPGPAVVLYLPLRFFGVDYVHPALAALLFALVGLGFLVATFLLVVRRLLPRTPAWVKVVGIATLAAGNLMPYVLARIYTYEIVIAGAFCFAWIGMWMLLREALSERPRRRGYAGASLFFGLAFASRPTVGVVSLLLVGLAVLALRPDLRDRHARGIAAALLVPFGAVALLLLAYNAARFGSPAEFGQQYVLSLPSVRYRDLGSLSYIPAGAWSYLVAPPVPRLQFPFFLLPPPPGFPGPLPRGYITEPTAGIFTAQPLVLILLVAPFLATVRGRLRVIVTSLTVVGVLCALWLSWIFFSTVHRYEADYAALLVLPAVLVWASTSTVARTWLRRLALGAGAALALVGAAVNLAATIVRDESPLVAKDAALYARLERFFSPLPTLAATLAGRPMLASINDDAYGSDASWGQVSLEGSDVYVQGGTKLTIVSQKSQIVQLTGTRLEVYEPGWPAGTQGGLVVEANGRIETAPVEGRAATVAVQLRRGLNRLDLSVARVPPVPPEQQASQTPVRLVDVRLRP